MIKDPELIKEITVKSFDHFTDRRSFIGEELDSFWARNLFASNGQRWRNLRNTLSPSFTGSKLKMMHDLIRDCAQQFVDFFLQQNEDIINIEARQTFSKYSNDVIATTAFGVQCNSLQKPENEFFRMGQEAVNFTGLKFLKFFLYGMSPALAKVRILSFIFNFLHFSFQLLKIKVIPSKISDYFTRIITETVKIRKDLNIIRPDMIHLLLEAQKEETAHITLDDIVSQAFVYYLAGFETVSTFLSFAFYELTVHPDIQQRLRLEIEKNFHNLTYENVQNMKYLEMVTSEVLRKWPAMGFIDRKVTKPYTITAEKPLHLEEGLICFIPMFAVQNDPKHFPDPTKFDPERFNDVNKPKINPYAYLPFGSGPRACIGVRFALLEAKLLICYVLKNFAIVPISKTKIPLVLDKTQINLAAEGGIWLGLQRLKI